MVSEAAVVYRVRLHWVGGYGIVKCYNSVEQDSTLEKYMNKNKLLKYLTIVIKGEKNRRQL